MKIAHKAFIDLEQGLADRTAIGWRKMFATIGPKLKSAINVKDWHKANQIVDEINTDQIVKDNAQYALSIGVSSLLLGASRLSDLKTSKAFTQPPVHQIGNGVTQWANTVAKNVPAMIKLKLHQKLAQLENEAHQAHQAIAKDDTDFDNSPELAVDDLIDSIQVNGENFMSVASSLMVSRLSSFGFLAEAQDQNIDSYMISAVLDDHTCSVCEALDGQIFSTSDGVAQASAIMDANDSDSLSSIAPWPSQSASSVRDIQDSDAQDLVDSGLQLPPYHPNCRCITVDVPESDNTSQPDTDQDITTDQPQDDQSEAQQVSEIKQDVSDVEKELGQHELALLMGLITGTLVGVGHKNIHVNREDIDYPDEEDYENLQDNDDFEDEDPDSAQSDSEFKPAAVRGKNGKKKVPLNYGDDQFSDSTIEKFDPWHDPSNGEFSSGPGANPVKDYQSKVAARTAFAMQISPPNKMSPDEKQALSNYSLTGYTNVNGYLRNPKMYREGENADTKATISGLDSLIDKGTVPKDIDLYRGLSGNASKVLGGKIDKSLVGKTFTDKGFISTSLSEDTALKMSFDGEDGPRTLVEIEVPKGTHAAAMSLNFDYEKEIILPRGTTFRVKSVTTETMQSTVGTNYGKVRKIIVEPIGVVKSETSEPIELSGDSKFVWGTSSVKKFDPWHDPTNGEFTGPGMAASRYTKAMDARATFAESITSRKMTDDERDDFSWYTGTGYQFINSYLRTGKISSRYTPKLPEKYEVDHAVGSIDSLIAKGSLPRDINLYRGIEDVKKTLGNDFGPDLVGKTFTDNGYISTSISLDTALSMSVSSDDDKTKTMIEIEAPKGMHAAANVLNFEYEKEVVLPRGTTFKVKSIATEHMKSTVGTDYGDVHKIVIEPILDHKIHKDDDSEPIQLTGDSKFIWNDQIV